MINNDKIKKSISDLENLLIGLTEDIANNTIIYSEWEEDILRINNKLKILKNYE
jgi:hypothetical protein